MRVIKFQKVTVIIPVYNRSSLVKEAIDSVLSQNYPNVEIIVINDGSTDATLKVLKMYGKKIRLFSQRNQGETKSVNRGFKIATGKYLIYLGSDDTLLQGSLKESVRFMENNPSILVGYPDCKLIDESGKQTGILITHEYDYDYMFTRHHCLIVFGAVIRRDALKFVKGRNISYKYVADFEFWLRLGLYGEFKRIPMCLATVRLHTGSQSSYGKGKQMADEHIKLVREISSLPNFPIKLKRKINQAYSSAFFHAASVSLKWNSKIKYYFLSLIKSPLIFIEKCSYELVKFKHWILSPELV